MKRMLSLLLLSFSLYAAQSTELSETQEVKRISHIDIANHAQYWANQIPELSREEYSLLANLLYFDCLTKHYESFSRSMMNAIYSQLIIMNRQLVKNEADSKKTADNTSAKLQQFYDELLPLRSYSRKSLKACSDEIEKSEYKMLKEIISNVQKYSQAIIEQCIKQDQESITKLIQNEKNILENHVATLNSCKDIYDGLLENNNPYLKEGSNPIIGNIDVSVLTADNVLAIINDLALASIEIRNISSDILNVHSLITRTFCNALIELSAKNKSEAIQLMFDENGLIKKENRDENIVKLDSKFAVHKKHYTTL